MSVRATPQATRASAGYEDYADDGPRLRLGLVRGRAVAAARNPERHRGHRRDRQRALLCNGQHYIIGNLKTWGWIVLCIGVLQLAVGLGVFVKNQFSRWAGVVVLAANAIAQMLMIPGVPVLVAGAVHADIVAIYGLVAYGHASAGQSLIAPARRGRYGPVAAPNRAVRRQVSTIAV